jgi:tetratricopeptide (TPR) repeat protein
MMKQRCLHLLFCLFCLAFLCGFNSKVKGKAIDIITKKPIVNTTIVASTKIDILEDKKYERREGKTDINGDFVIKGLSPQYRYTISANAAGYISSKISARPPKENKTRILDRPIVLILSPNQNGIHIWNNNSWKKLDNNISLKSDKSVTKMRSFSDLYIPTDLKEKKIIKSSLRQFTRGISETDWVEGDFSKKAKIDKAYSLNDPVLFAITGHEYRQYKIIELYYYPEVTIYDKGKSYPGTYNRSEGYHLGTKRIRGRGQCCVFLGLKREEGEIKSLSKICKNKLDKLSFGYWLGNPDGYYAIVNPNNSEAIVFEIKQDNAAAPMRPQAQVPQTQTTDPGRMSMIVGLEKETRANPNNLQAWIELGNSYFDTGQHAKSIQAYRKALELDPSNANVWADMGVMYRRSGNPQEAIRSFDKAIEVDPKHEVSRMNKGIVLLYDMNDMNGAIKAWEGLLAVNPVAVSPTGQSIDQMIKQMKQQLQQQGPKN